jgi:cytidylate kinase
MIITIDGPAASGKSSVARKLADKLGFMYLNSGFLFRAVAYLVYDRNIPVGSLPTMLYVGPDSPLQYRSSPKTGPQVLYHHEDITPFLKTPSMDQLSSELALDPLVRNLVRVYQQKSALTQSIVAEGRDCGTAIFPHANYKFFLTASDSIRAERWQKELSRKGIHCDLSESLQSIQERDRRDSERAIDPLTIPQDSEVVDTSSLTIQEVVDRLTRKVQQNKSDS